MLLGRSSEYLANEIYHAPARMLGIVCFAALLLLPLFTSQPHVLRLVITANIFGVFAASWDLITGYVGQLVLGHALFFGAAAYTSAILNTTLGWPPFVAIPAGALVAVLAGLIAGFPALRLKGLYLGLTTLAMPIVVVGIVHAFPDLSGGEQGITGITLLAENRVVLYYVTLFVMIGSVAVLLGITRSKVGLIFQAIRDDEVAAQAAGVNTTLYKLLAFCSSGLFAGVAGGLYAHFIRVVGPSVLDFNLSLEPIIWTIFGGATTIYGPVIGVFVLLPVVETLRSFLGENASVIYYVILVLAVIFAPGGLARWISGRLEKVCSQCDTRNAFTRRQCRACSAQLGATGVALFERSAEKWRVG